MTRLALLVLLSQAVAVSSSLPIVDLSDNEIRASGADFLSQDLSTNSSVTQLDSSNDKIRSFGAAFPS